MRGMLILVSGGAASGKSEFAESLAVSSPGLPRIYLATMKLWDAECEARAEKHRAMRAGKGSGAAGGVHRPAGGPLQPLRQ